jgi:hypothetical protein
MKLQSLKGSNEFSPGQTSKVRATPGWIVGFESAQHYSCNEKILLPAPKCDGIKLVSHTVKG